MSSIFTHRAKDSSIVGIDMEAKSVTVLAKTIEPSTMSFTALPIDSANTLLNHSSCLSNPENPSSLAGVPEQKTDILLPSAPGAVIERKSDISLIVKWKLLDFPGISLVNTLNKCWFHA